MMVSDISGVNSFILYFNSRMAKLYKKLTKRASRQRGGASQTVTLVGSPVSSTSFMVAIPPSGDVFDLPSGAITAIGYYIGTGGAQIQSYSIQKSVQGSVPVALITITGGTIPLDLKSGTLIPYSPKATGSSAAPKPLSLVDNGEVQYGVSINGAPPNNTEIVVKNDNYVKPGDASSGTTSGFPSGTGGVGYLLTGAGVPAGTTIKSYRFGSSNFGGKYKAIFLQLSNPITPQTPAATYNYAPAPLAPSAYWTASGGGKSRRSKSRGVSRRR
jgi:hypothetical protein